MCKFTQTNFSFGDGFEHQEIKWISIDSLKDSGKQFRKHSKKKIELLAKQLKKFQVCIPLVVNENYEIVSGFARFLAAKKLGLKILPIILVSNLTSEELEVYKIAENQITIEGSNWDLPLLKFEFEKIKELNFDLELTGFEIPKFEAIIYDKNQSSVTDEKLLPSEDDPQIIRRVKSGDIWQLGNHKLLCGDSTKLYSFNQLLKDEKVNMVITDPPYNLQVKNIVGNGKIQHDEFSMASGEMSSEEFTQFLAIVMQNIQNFCLDGSLAYFFMDWRHCTEILNAGKTFNQLLNICVWNKMQGGMGSMYRSQHEFVFVFKNGSASHVNNIQLGKFGRNRSNVWDFKGVHVTNPENKGDLMFHPTVKPVKMIEEAILDASNPKEIILDCFAGSGSTLLACENVGRHCRAIEYEEKYCDVILHRWQLLTSKEPEFVCNINNNKEV